MGCIVGSRGVAAAAVWSNQHDSNLHRSRSSCTAGRRLWWAVFVASNSCAGQCGSVGLVGCGRLSVAPKSRWSRKCKSAGAAFVSVTIGKAKGSDDISYTGLAGLHPRGHIPRQHLRRRKAGLDVATLSNPASHAISLCHDVHLSGLLYSQSSS